MSNRRERPEQQSYLEAKDTRFLATGMEHRYDLFERMREHGLAIDGNEDVTWLELPVPLRLALGSVWCIVESLHAAANLFVRRCDYRLQVQAWQWANATMRKDGSRR